MINIGLENRRARKGTVGSNPTPSAIAAENSRCAVVCLPHSTPWLRRFRQPGPLDHRRRS